MMPTRIPSKIISPELFNFTWVNFGMMCFFFFPENRPKDQQATILNSAAVLSFSQYFLRNFLKHLFLFERQWNRARAGEGQRERGRHRTRSRLRAFGTEPDVGLEPTNDEIMTRAEVRCLANWATRVPLSGLLTSYCLLTILLVFLSPGFGFCFILVLLDRG